MAKKKKRKGKKGHIPLTILQARYRKLGSVLKRRGGLV